MTARVQEALSQWRKWVPRVTLVDTIRNYNKDGLWTERLSGDLAAGLVVAVMLIPQGMAYSALAGLPPIYGLYSSIWGLLLYPLFGTSPQLSTAPVAMMSLLTTAAIGEFELPEEGTDERVERYKDLAFKLAFLVGIIQTAMGLFRAGFLVNFLSHPVLKGFTSAAALIIGSSQLGKVLGLKLERRAEVYLVWRDVILNLGDTHILSLVLTIENLAAFYLFRWIKKSLRTLPSVKANKTYDRMISAVPNALIVVIINILIVYGQRLDKEGVKIVGDIPQGLPGGYNVFNDTFGSDFGKLFVPAIIMSMVGFMESISVAKAMALRFESEVDSNQELVGLGGMNVVGSFLQSFPTTGGFSRTSVNADAGAKTTLAGMISGVILIITVQFLTPLFHFLPQVTLGTLIIFAVAKLIEFDTPKMLWRVDKSDLFVYFVAFAFTIGLGIENGILIGAGVALIRVIKESATPHVAVLGRLPDGHTWRNVKRYPEAKEEPGLKVIRFDAPLYFANSTAFRDLILDLCTPTEKKPRPEAIVLDCGAVTTMDSSAIHMLETLPKDLQKHAQQIRDRRLRDLRDRLSDLEGNVRRDHSPPDQEKGEGASQRPGPAMEELLDETADSRLPDDPAILRAWIDALREAPLKIPTLFFADMRGPVRDVLERNDRHIAILNAEKARWHPSFWNCTYPFTCRNPFEHTCQGVEVETHIRKRPSLREKDSGDDSSIDDEVGDVGPTGKPSHGHDELTSFVLQEKDIDAAVRSVTRLLQERRRALSTHGDDTGDIELAAAGAVSRRRDEDGEEEGDGAAPEEDEEVGEGNDRTPLTPAAANANDEDGSRV